MLAADDAGRPAGAWPRGADTEGGGAAAGGQPSMALTVSVLCEDVFATWAHLLGEAVEEALLAPTPPQRATIVPCGSRARSSAAAASSPGGRPFRSLCWPSLPVQTSRGASSTPSAESTAAAATPTTPRSHSTA